MSQGTRRPSKAGTSQAKHAMTPPDYNLKGFEFTGDLKSDQLKALLERPGDFSNSKDKPKDIAVKRLIILFATATAYASFADSRTFGNDIANDIMWANQRYIGVVLQRYTMAREAYCSDENRPSIPAGTARLNGVLCGLVDDFGLTKNTTRYKFTPARIKYVAKVRTAWRLAMKKSFYELLNQPPVMPGPDQDPDWLETVLTASEASSSGTGRTGTGPDTAPWQAPAPVFHRPAATGAALGAGLLVGQPSAATDSTPNQGQAAGRERKEERAVTPPETTQPVAGTEVPDTHPPAGPARRTPPRNIASIIWAYWKYRLPPPERKTSPSNHHRAPPPAYHTNKAQTAPVSEHYKLQTLLSTSLGMASVMEGLLAQPESGQNRHENYALARNMARNLAGIYRRCLRTLGKEPKDTQIPLRAQCCEFDKVSEVLKESQLQAFMTEGFLDQGESVPGLHEEYRDALELARLCESFCKSCLQGMDAEVEGC